MVEAVLSATSSRRIGARVLPFVNGMGGTPQLELYLLYGEVERLLREPGSSRSARLVGSYITSLEMAGASLTLLELDDELEPSCGMLPSTPRRCAGERDAAVITETAVQRLTVIAWMPEIAAAVRAERRLPHAARRRDRRRRPRDQHDPRVRRGRQGAGRPGRTTSPRAGCWSSPARRWSRRSAARAARCGARRCAAPGRALGDGRGVRRRGARRRRSTRRSPRSSSSAPPSRATRRWSTRSRRPSRRCARGLDAGEPRRRSPLGAAADAAEEGARATVPMQARKGRASYLGERSIGHQDPGATSAALIMRALRRAVDAGGLTCREARCTASPASPGVAVGASACSPLRRRRSRAVPPERRGAEVERARRRSARLRPTSSTRSRRACAPRAASAEAEIVETGALMAARPGPRSGVEASSAIEGLAAAGGDPSAADAQPQTLAALADETLAARADDVRSLGRRARPARERRLERGERRGVGGGDRGRGATSGPPTSPSSGRACAAIALGRRGRHRARRDRRPLARRPDGGRARRRRAAAAAGRSSSSTATRASRSCWPRTPTRAGRGRARPPSERAARARARATRDLLPAITTRRARASRARQRRRRRRGRAGARRRRRGRRAAAHRARVPRRAATGRPRRSTGARSQPSRRRCAAGPRPCACSTSAATSSRRSSPTRRAPRDRAAARAPPSALAAQLRAILGAGAATPSCACCCRWSRAPTSVDRVDAALARAVAAVPARPSRRSGAMIETPEAADAAAELAARADFLSIGTNDLTPRRSAPTASPPAQRAPTTRACCARSPGRRRRRGAGIPIEVCGEAASDPVALPLLVGLGVDELSVGAARVGAVRGWVARWTSRDAEALARSGRSGRQRRRGRRRSSRPLRGALDSVEARRRSRRGRRRRARRRSPSARS